jgi:hypothetical protein
MPYAVVTAPAEVVRAADDLLVELGDDLLTAAKPQ